MTIAPTKCIVSYIDDIKFCFELFWTWSIKPSGKHDQLGGETDLQKELEGGNPERNQSIYGSFDPKSKAYMGLLILSDVYRSRNKFTSSFWDAETSQTRVRCTQMKYSRSLLTGNITDVTLCDCIKIVNSFEKCLWCI